MRSSRFCKPLPTCDCREARLLRSAFCSGVKSSVSLPVRSGLLADFGRLLHGLLLLLEQFLSILDDTPVGLELAQAVEHLLKLVGDRFLVRLRLGQSRPAQVRIRLLRLIPGVAGFALSFDWPPCGLLPLVDSPCGLLPLVDSPCGLLPLVDSPCGLLPLVDSP